MALNRAVPIPKIPLGAAADWLFPYPNTADFNFNYFQLLQAADGSAIGQAADPSTRIAVVGAGIAGLVAARELFRCGFRTIHIYEASDRIGGRTYSVPSPNGSSTAFEMGAMRIPFFSHPGAGGCALDYYREIFRITTQIFPDPHVVDTGIFVNNGFGPDPTQPLSEPTLLLWPAGDTPPPTQILQSIYNKWGNFANLFAGAVADAYNAGGATWSMTWHEIVDNYFAMNFRDLALLPAVTTPNNGNFGGLGLTPEEADAFYVIGAGDGSWGAFYDVSCLYVIRTLLFGFGYDHQLIQGIIPITGEQNPGPFFGSSVKDSHGLDLPPPSYRGVQSFAECMLYYPASNGLSLYDAMSMDDFDIRLALRMPVTGLAPLESGQVAVGSGVGTFPYDAVIVTPSTWALEMSTALDAFPADLVPSEVVEAINVSHWITSAKVMYPLRQRYWEVSNIPQVIVTDTFIQDVYGWAVGPDDPGVILVAYTWEDDATKLAAISDPVELSAQCLGKLDEILLKCRNINARISPFVDTDKAPAVIHWELQPSYRGCAKLYRERSWALDYALLTYNQTYSGKSKLYFAGEGVSVEGGWTEPAVRHALDAVLYILKNTGSTFLNGFDFDANYPIYDTSWAPSQPAR